MALSLFFSPQWLKGPFGRCPGSITFTLSLFLSNYLSVTVQFLLLLDLFFVYFFCFILSLSLTLSSPLTPSLLPYYSSHSFFPSFSYSCFLTISLTLSSPLSLTPVSPFSPSFYYHLSRSFVPSLFKFLLILSSYLYLSFSSSFSLMLSSLTMYPL